MPRDHQSDIHAIIDGAMRAADPRRALAESLALNPPRVRHPAVIAIGKAAPAMMAGYCDAFARPDRWVMVVPEGVAAPPGAIIADHPVPTSRCVAAAERVRAFVQDAAPGPDGFVVLLSGGASALVTLPVPGLALDDYAAAVHDLLRRGVEIRALNCIRKHCEQLKGGRLAALMGRSPCDTHILSDVIGDDLETVGSGPTLPDSTTRKDARDILETRFAHSRAAGLLLPHLRAIGNDPLAETPKPGQLANVRAFLAGSNATALRAAESAARAMGYVRVVATEGVTGSASAAGRRLALEALRVGPSGAVIYGGETTVDVEGKSGRGGRNQELALAAALQIDGRPGVTIAAFATDGIDGMTDVAGAIVTGQTCAQARALRLNPAAALAEHDSYTFFDILDSRGCPHLIRTGPTGTNVNDLSIALVS